MNKTELLKYCRYYKGENEPPKGQPWYIFFFWSAECAAVRSSSDPDYNEDEDLDYFVKLGDPGAGYHVPRIIRNYLYFEFCKGSDAAPWDESHLKRFSERIMPAYMGLTSM